MKTDRSDDVFQDSNHDNASVQFQLELAFFIQLKRFDNILKK